MNEFHGGAGTVRKAATVFVGNCSGVFLIPEEELAEYYAGHAFGMKLCFGAAGLVAAAIALVNVVN